MDLLSRISIPRLLYFTFYTINFLIMWSLVFRKRERPEKVLGWLLVLMLLPPVGLVLYLYMGINWRDTRLNDKFSPAMSNLIDSSLERYEGPHEDIARQVSNTNASPLFEHNRIRLYKDGMEKFPDLLEDIKNAKHHIHLEYYIVRADGLGMQIFEALMERAKAGVKVRFIVDKIGGRTINGKLRKDLKEAGIELVTFTAAFAFVSRFIDMSLNYRLHRKMVIIDGKIGYIGGNNIGDEYISKGPMGYWRDTHMRVEGDFVLGMQALFLEDFYAVLHRNEESKIWEYHKQREIYEPEHNLQQYFIRTEVTDILPMQICYSGPESSLYSLELLFLKMIATAKERIFIFTPYFVPSDGTMSALKAAIMSGVDVRIMFPAQYDHPIVQHASMTYLGDLLEVGASLYLYDKSAFTHTKAMVCDGRTFTTGTTNFDVRSFFFNYEVNAVVYDEYYSAKMEGHFKLDMESAKEMTLEQYLKRPKSTFMKESFFRVFSLLF